TPRDRELCEADLGRFDGRGGVDLSQFAGDLTPVFLRRVTQTVPHQVHDTGLHGRVGPRRADRVRQALEAVATHDQRVGDATVAELGEHGHPLLRALTAGRTEPEAEDVA